MSRQQHPVTILIAEDDPDDCLLIKEAFAEGANPGDLQFVVDGEDLLARLRNQGMYADRVRFPHPALLLLDLNMPRVDGRQALAEIKSDPVLRSLPVVVLTTSREIDDVRRSYSQGANSYIAKPDTFAGLSAAIRSLRGYWLDVVELPVPEGLGD